MAATTPLRGAGTTVVEPSRVVAPASSKPERSGAGSGSIGKTWSTARRASTAMASITYTARMLREMWCTYSTKATRLAPTSTSASSTSKGIPWLPARPSSASAVRV